MNFAEIGQNFIHAYFSTWNMEWRVDEAGNLQVLADKRENLAQLYTPESLCTMQGEELVGVEKIMEKLMSEGLRDVIRSDDEAQIFITSQPSLNGTILIVCQGVMKMTPLEENPLPFTETFVIAPAGGSVQIVNQIFTTHSF